jgi:putative peptidoglycan lipid II flippase
MINSPRISVGLFLSLALMAGRVAGFIRELLLAANFGVSAEADVAIALLTIPDLLVNLLLSGGLAVALIPAIQQVSEDRKCLLINQAALLVAIVFGIFGFLFLFLSNFFFALIAPGIDIDSLSLSNTTLALIAFSIPFTALSGVTTAALNANNRFFIAGFGTLIFNSAIIFTLLIAIEMASDGLFLVCLGIWLGSALRLGTQGLALIPFLRKGAKKCKSEWLITGNFLKSFTAGLCAASILILVPVVIRAAASYFGEGNLATFNYVLKLVELPVGVMIGALATVAYPKLSSAFSERDGNSFNGILLGSLIKIMVLSTAVALCGLQFGDAVVDLLFGFDRISDLQRSEISSLTKIGVFSIPFAGFSILLTAAHNAKKTPSYALVSNIIAFVCLGFLLALSLIFKSPMWLIGSLPLFYLILNLLLIRHLEIKFNLSHIKFLLSFSLMVSVMFLIFSALDGLVVQGFLVEEKLQALIRVILGSLAFLLMTLFGFRMVGKF